MLECPNCNKTLDDEFKFCPYCGIKIMIKPIGEEGIKSTSELLSEEIERIEDGIIYLLIMADEEYDLGDPHYDYEKGYGKALKEVERLKELGYLESYYYHKAVILNTLKHYHASLTNINKAIELNHDNPHYYRIKGNCLKQLHRYDEELECWDKLIKITPEFDEEYYLNIADCLKQLKQHTKSVQYYDLLLKNLEDDKHCFTKEKRLNYYYLGKAECLKELGEYNEALKCYDACIEIKPKSGKYYGIKGLFLKDLKGPNHYNDAIDCLEKAIHLGSNKNIKYYYQLQELKEKQKKYDFYKPLFFSKIDFYILLVNILLSTDNFFFL